jgi:predicted RNase H-like nuclease (RuvC/YqgF family)
VNGEEMMRRIEELTRALEAKDKHIRKLEAEIERLKPPKRGRVDKRLSTRLERLLAKVNKKPG